MIKGVSFVVLQSPQLRILTENEAFLSGVRPRNFLLLTVFVKEKPRSTYISTICKRIPPESLNLQQFASLPPPRIVLRPMLQCNEKV